MTICSHCNAELYTDSIAGARSVRCAGCGGVNLSGEEKGSGNQNRDAWYSLVLGMASLICSFVAGLPAIFFGIRALRKMRYLPTSGRAKTAAISGTVAGFFGTFVIGSCLAFFGIIVGATQWVEEYNSPVEAAKFSKQIGSFESNVVGLKSRKAFRLPSIFQMAIWTDDQLDVHWLDNRNPRTVYHWQESDRSVSIIAAKVPGLVNRLQIKQMMRDTHLGRWRNRKQTAKETLKWKFLGTETEVWKNIYQDQSEEYSTDKPAGTDSGDAANDTPESEYPLDQLDQYSTLAVIDGKNCTMVLNHRPAESGLTPEDIRQIFESYKLTDELEE